jgi:O-antigen/teichoic acid export membrane protein
VVIGSGWFLAMALSAIIATANLVGVALLPLVHNYQLALCIRWVGLTYLSTVGVEVVSWKLQAEEKYPRIFWYRLINSASTILSFSVLIMLHHMTLENALFFNMLTNFFVSVLGVMQGSGIRHISKRTRACMVELLHYGKYMLGTTTCSALLNNADTWVINFVLGPAAVAVYNLAVRFMTVVDLPLRSLITTGMSEMAIAYNRSDMPHIAHIFKKYAGMLTVAFVPMIIIGIIIADIPTNILGGAKYSHSIAANSFRLFLLASVLYPLDRFNGLVLDVTRQTRINFYKVILMLATKFAFNFIGLAIFGNIYGVNLSTFMVIAAAILYGNYQLHKRLDYRIVDILSLGYQEVKALATRRLKLYRFRNTVE